MHHPFNAFSEHPWLLKLTFLPAIKLAFCFNPQCISVPQNPDSEAARRRAEADCLRAAEEFMVIGSGEASCKSCGFEYLPKNGDPEYPVSKGTLFQVSIWLDPCSGWLSIVVNYCNLSVMVAVMNLCTSSPSSMQQALTCTDHLRSNCILNAHVTSDGESADVYVFLLLLLLLLAAAAFLRCCLLPCHRTFRPTTTAPSAARPRRNSNPA